MVYLNIVMENQQINWKIALIYINNQMTSDYLVNSQKLNSEIRE